MWRAALLLLGMYSCASAPAGPFFDDQRYLRFGVDPDKEAASVIESQKARGYPLALRLLGQHFTALGFMDKGGRSAAVRILTPRGIAVALDSRPETPLQAPVAYALIEPAIAGTHDADVDGFEEIMVEERTRGEACLRLFRVRDVGFVDPVVTDTWLMGQEFCPRSALDLNADGVVELVTELVLTGFEPIGATATAAHLQLPLWASEHRFVARSGSAAQRAWLAQERARRETELQRARAKLDLASSFALAIELAALTHLEGGDPAAQLGAFDRALAGLVLTRDQAAAKLRASSRIYTEWNAPALAPEAAASDPAKATNAAVTPTPEKPTREASAPPPRPRSPADGTARSAPEDDILRRRLLEYRRAAKTDGAVEPASTQHGWRPRPAPRGSNVARPPISEPASEAKSSQLPAAVQDGSHARVAARTGAATPALPARPHSGSSAQRGDEPVLEEGDIVITPAIAAAEEARRRALRAAARLRSPAAAGEATARNVGPVPAEPGGAAAQRWVAQQGTLQPQAADAVQAHRMAAREQGNAAAEARIRAATARRAAAAERSEAQAARIAALSSDPTRAAELRETVAAHVEAARRYVAEAAEAAAEAERHRAALAEHKAAAFPAQAEQPPQ